MNYTAKQLRKGMVVNLEWVGLPYNLYHDPFCTGTFGRVQHELDQEEGKTPAQIVENFRVVLAHMLTLAPTTALRAGKKGETKVAKVVANEEGGTTVEVNEDNAPARGSDDDIRTRRELILRVAAEKNVAVSPRTASLFQDEAR